MDRISDEFLEYKIAVTKLAGFCEAISINSDVLLPMLEELVERREAEQSGTSGTLPKHMQLDEALRCCERIAGANCNDCGNGYFRIACWLQKLKERRAADKLLDIKGCLRTIINRCPDEWETITDCICPNDVGLNNCMDNGYCRLCWHKALEGDE